VVDDPEGGDGVDVDEPVDDAARPAAELTEGTASGRGIEVADTTDATAGDLVPAADTPTEPFAASSRRRTALDRIATFTDEAVAFGRDNSASICFTLTLSGIATFSILFGTLAVVNHRN
jgi:hypothetical protein